MTLDQRTVRLSTTEDLCADVTEPVDGRFDAGRRTLLAGFGGAGALALIFARSASAQTNVDVQILQTASSLERLAVNTYETALQFDFIAGGNPMIKEFCERTLQQHNVHLKAFQDQTEELGGERQDAPNRKFLEVVERAAPSLRSPLDFVSLAADLEEVATETYLLNLSTLRDAKSKELVASVMGVTAQCQAILETVKTLLSGGSDSAVAIPVDANQLPRSAGSAAFQEALVITDSRMSAEPSTGDVR